MPIDYVIPKDNGRSATREIGIREIKIRGASSRTTERLRLSEGKYHTRIYIDERGAADKRGNGYGGKCQSTAYPGGLL